MQKIHWVVVLSMA